MASSNNFELLDDKVKHWIWKKGWESLRDIQEQAIKPILEAKKDVIISASTAAGKTEAAFLPACSNMIKNKTTGVFILYISPLKALINDQYRRLESLCEILDVSITPWHGDVPQSLKNKQKINPSGVLLITPESLESLLLNNSGWCFKAFQNLGYIIIDEFHAFIGTERGCQLQSLMHRMEFLIEKTIPRIALSATLGDMNEVAWNLRPNKKIPCEMIVSTTSRSDLRLQVKGYINNAQISDDTETSLSLIVNDLYSLLRGKSNLIFANSRNRTEEISAMLSDKCSNDSVPNEFFPHHGSLSRELRESLEHRLQEEKRPTSAVCTMTLELGIDIGSVDSIAQVRPPHSVASLRQRLGRSGRRGDPAILRMFIEEDELTSKSYISDFLRFDIFLSIAIINLLLKKWYEPSSKQRYHFSTLVQQTLSVIGQYGGVRAEQLWILLCETGPFSRIDKSLYITFLRALGNKDLISQSHDGQLTLGLKGEKLVGHFSFFTAFQTPEEYRLEYNGKTIGTLPIDFPLSVNQLIIFAGKRWEVLDINEKNKVIVLKKNVKGKAPKFGGSGLMIDDMVIKEMLNVYLTRESPVYLDKTAKILFEEGINSFCSLGLDKQQLIKNESSITLVSWTGDRITFTIHVLFLKQNISSNYFGGPFIEMQCTIDELKIAISAILKQNNLSNAQLASDYKETQTGKHDHFLTKELCDLDFGEQYFDIKNALDWLLKSYNRLFKKSD